MEIGTIISYFLVLAIIIFIFGIKLGKNIEGFNWSDRAKTGIRKYYRGKLYIVKLDKELK